MLRANVTVLPDDPLIFDVQTAAVILLAAGLASDAVMTVVHRRSVARIVASLGEAPAPGPLESALARALGDPELHIAYSLPDVQRKMPPTHTDESLIAARAIRADHPEIGVLVLSQYVEPSYAMRLIQDHPERVGYLLKERVFDIAIVVGETVIDPTIDREREVLGLLAEGMSNRAIAARLFVTERTVEAHVTQILLKLCLAESPDQHRRVLAMLTFLRA